MISTLDTRIANLEATLAKLEAAGAADEDTETIREMLAAYRAVSEQA